MELSKRWLGVGYLAVTAGLLGSVLLVRLVPLVPSSNDTLATATGIGASLALGYAAYWLLGSSLDDDRIWTVAIWGGVGIGVVTLVGLVVAVTPLPTPGTDVLVSNVAAGGLVGVLIGGIRELNRELERTARLNERNTVLNRVLRHNVRNDMNVVIGYVDTLAARLDGPPDELDVIRERAGDLSSLAAKARRAEEAVASEPRDEPVDVAEVVDRRVAMLRDAYPGAAVAVDRPDSARVEAGEEVDVIVRNLLENAAEHADGSAPSVDVTVDRDAESVEIRVEDDGEPIPETERRPVMEGGESDLDHCSGMGLWLVKWLVERHDGDLAFEVADDGNVVRIRLPRATGDSLLRTTGNYFP